MMDKMSSKDGYFDTDLEKGRVDAEVDSKGGNVFGTIGMIQHGTDQSEERGIPSIALSCNDGLGSVKSLVVDKNCKEGEERKEKIVKAKPKAMSAKKPPRPPRGLSLDSADQKLIRELNELARLKRVRVERMKMLKKAKEAKALSSKNQLFATLLTVLFCVVLLVQGMSSRTNSDVNFPGSPTPSGVIMESSNIISVEQRPISSTPHYNNPVSESHRLEAEEEKYPQRSLEFRALQDM